VARRPVADPHGSRAESLGSGTEAGGPAAVFARIVDSGLADAAVIFDSDGRLAYPAPATPPPRPAGHPSDAWRAAERLGRQDKAAAADAWRRIARETDDEHLAARALQAAIRALLQSEREGEALELLRNELDRERFAAARDSAGRLIVPSSQLLALELLDSNSNEFLALAERLRQRLESYEGPTLPASQRRFLRARLSELVPEASPFASDPAEALAAAFVESGGTVGAGVRLETSELDDVWKLTSPEGSVIGLFEDASLAGEMATWASYFTVPGESSIAVLPPGALIGPQSSPLVALPAEEPLAGWRLTLDVLADNQHQAVANQQIRVYRWTAAFVLALVLLVAVLVGLTLRHQLQLTALKNDLLSTVSHELKTPLASMRLLIETLLDDSAEPERLREYLELMATENQRLSRLVEHFLTFSRLSHGRQRLHRDLVTPESVVEAAVTSAADRLEGADCDFRSRIEPDLPPLVGDRDALTTAVLNLLDNAWKYSGADKQIRLRSWAENGHVAFAVSDNGVGLSAREASQVFDRFYQGEQRSGGDTAGCGLGLSIVQLIARAHGGEASVESSPGEGSTFTIRVPVDSGE
jgi:signal transduction histidine kinase